MAPISPAPEAHATGPHLLLIGLRASGKSTLGAALARALARPFIDLDDRTAQALGAPDAARAWAAHGEPAFRAAETGALRDALRGPRAVIALGGGTPTAPGAADLLRAACAARTARIVYLAAPPALLRARLARTDLATRPPLTPRGTLDEIDAVHAARDPLYRALASRTIELDGTSTPDGVLAALRSIAGGHEPDAQPGISRP